MSDKNPFFLLLLKCAALLRSRRRATRQGGCRGEIPTTGKIILAEPELARKLEHRGLPVYSHPFVGDDQVFVIDLDMVNALMDDMTEIRL